MKRQWKWGLEDLFNLVAYYRNRRWAQQHSAGYDEKFCARCDELGYIGCFCGQPASCPLCEGEKNP